MTNAHLKTLHFAYRIFCSAYKRAPTNIDEFTPYLVSTVYPDSGRKLEEECLRQVKAGKYVVVWNQPGVLDAKEGTDILIAYEARVAEGGGFAVFADGRVQWMTTGELERATRREKAPPAAPGTSLGDDPAVR
jgi:hypothetical protein